MLVALGSVGLYLGNIAGNGRDGPTRAGDTLAAAVGASTPAGPRTIIQDSLSPPQVWKNYAGKTLECTFDTDVKLFIVGTDKNTSQRCLARPSRCPPTRSSAWKSECNPPIRAPRSGGWTPAPRTTSWCSVPTVFVQRNFGPDKGAQPLAGAQLKTAITLGTANRVVITIKDYIAEVNVNGTLIGRAVLSDRSRTSGTISLGINGRGDGKAAGGFGVTFGNVKVATPS
ncbi:hypothetical protein NKG94_52000 [Micromonospora sp. M12]